MTHHVNGRLRTFIVLIVLVVGAFFIARAVESKGVEVKVEKTTVLAEQWFVYNGPDQSRSEIEKPSNYQLSTSIPTCNNGTELCSIHAPNNGSGQPVLNESFVEQIMDALDLETPTSKIKLEN